VKIRNIDDPLLVVALGAVPVLLSFGFYLFLNPSDFWQRIVASLASMGLGFIVFIVEIVFLMVINSE